MTKKKIVKLAIIRSNEENKCPFGLPIPFGCKYAGNVIERMAPLDFLENSTDLDKEKIGAANAKLLSWSLMDSTYEPTKCLYAAKLFENKDVVECNFNDTAPGEGSSALRAPPFYSHIFDGIGMHGLFTYPIGYYADYDLSRNLWYGQWSVHSDKKEKDIIKEADKDEDDNNEQ